MVHFALFTNLPLYIKHIGGSNTMAGFSTTVFTIASLMFKPFFGLLIDKCGRKIAMILGALIVIVMAVLLFFTHSLGGILVLRAIHGIGFGALCTVVGTMIVDNVPAARLAEGIGYAGISLTVSMAAGPAAGAFLIQSIGYQACFVFVLITSLLTLAFALCLEYKAGRTPGESAGGAGAGIISSMYEKTAIGPSLLLLIISFGYGSVSTFITTYGAERGIANIGLFFVVYAVLALISRLGTGRLSDTKGEGFVFLPGLAALFGAYLFLAFADSLPLVLVAGGFYGFGYGIALPTLNVMLIRRCPENKRGAATAMLYSAMDIGVGGGAFLWGFLSEQSGFTTVYICSAATVTGAVVLYFILFRRRTSGEPYS